MSTPHQHRSTYRDIVVPYSLPECVERLQALHSHRQLFRYHRHAVQIQTLERGKVRFMVRRIGRSEEARVIGLLTPQGDNATHVRMRTALSPMAPFGFALLITFACVGAIALVTSLDNWLYSVGFVIFWLFVTMTMLASLSASRRTLTDTVIQQLQAPNPLHRPKDHA